MTPTVHHNLPASCFPLVIEYVDPVTRKVIWSKTVDEPRGGPVRVRIPSASKMFGHKVRVRIRYGDGTVIEEG